LADRGVQLLAPGSGSLACGEVGSGRMAEPGQIMQALGFSAEQAGLVGGAVSSGTAAEPAVTLRPADDSLAGVNVLITSGPTREYLDPVRFISSPSPGRMGQAPANGAARRGAHVHFIPGPVDATLLPGDCEIHRVENAREMLHQVESL